MSAVPVPTDGPEPVDLLATVHRIRARAEALGRIPVVEAGEDESERRLARWREVVPAEKFLSASPDDWEDRIKVRLVAWGEAQRDGVNLVLSGPVGTGKTRAAIGACRRPFMDGSSFAYMTMGRLMDALDYRSPEANRNRRRLQRVGVLVLDDVGSKRDIEWLTDLVTELLDERWLADRATVATTNLVPKVLCEAIGERAYSRLTQSGTIGLTLKGEDRRKVKGS